MPFIVTLCGAGTSKDVPVIAADEYDARRQAIAQNVRDGGPPMWVGSVNR